MSWTYLLLISLYVSKKSIIYIYPMGFKAVEFWWSYQLLDWKRILDPIQKCKRFLQVVEYNIPKISVIIYWFIETLDQWAFDFLYLFR